MSGMVPPVASCGPAKGNTQCQNPQSKIVLYALISEISVDDGEWRLGPTSAFVGSSRIDLSLAACDR